MAKLSELATSSFALPKQLPVFTLSPAPFTTAWLVKPMLSPIEVTAALLRSVAFEHLRTLGYTRPGLCCDPASDQEVARGPHAAFLLCQRQPPARDRIPVLTGMEPARFQALVADRGRHAPFLCGIEREPFEKWFCRHEPDVVLSSFRMLLDFLKSMPAKSPRTGFISLNRVGDLPTPADVDQNHERLAAAAVNVLVRKIKLNELGLTAQPETVVFGGTWHDGASAPRR